MDFIVGSFNYDLYTLRFESPSSSNSNAATLKTIRHTPAIGGHSWLALSKDKRFLYCTAWTKPSPSVAAYSIKNSGRDIQSLNTKRITALSGYVCCSDTHLYSVGGPTGEVFKLSGDGSIGELVQELSFVEPKGENMSEQRGTVAHGDFGGLRHGAHSVDLSPDGRSLYVADIGRNCIWTYSISNGSTTSAPRSQIGSRTSGDGTGGEPQPHLELASKHISPRSHDGPRHTWPHPNGKILYSLQEHSSVVDLFSISTDGVSLQHTVGVKIIPADKDPKEYWADEVRLSTGPDKTKPRYMYASTRGLKAETKGYVAVFPLNESGTLASETALDIWETPTSGGIANAIEPSPWPTSQSQDVVREGSTVEYLAMTDSEKGWVFILAFDGQTLSEVTRVNLGKTEDGQVVQAATAIWL
ncbi:hypothetical protein LTR36_001894 [Oleoguttula mirabilis]|uniref:Muconate cycloisomerase 1 n=1 Tax=Oleoguttula mirabilis TaxID=1507867 RepID=A0AAV9JQ68_9PEZI|nr:hypothetical protein LTR36_001894 [Oleoguttula mirabilis]